MSIRNLGLAILLISSSVFSQTFDFGLEFRVNNNDARLLKNEGTIPGITQPGYYDGDINNWHSPPQNVEFRGDNNHIIFGAYDEVRVRNNYEIPLVFTFTTKKNFFVQLKLSRQKIYAETEGSFHSSSDYYVEKYGDFNQFVAQHGDEFGNYPINNSQATYSSEWAYQTWLAERIETDHLAQFQLQHEEETVYTQAYLGVGYKFLKHKLIRPFFSLGMGFSSSSKSYRRQYFDMYNPDLKAVPVKQDLTILSREVTLLGDFLVTQRFEIGAQIYRYYGGFAFSANLPIADEPQTNELLESNYILNGFFTYSFNFGINLFQVSPNSKTFKKEIYSDEYKGLASKLDRSRLFSFSMNVEAPLYNRMNNYGDFTIWQHKDQIDTTQKDLNYSMHILQFKNITRVNWSPKGEIGIRISPVRRLDLELQFGISRLEYDTEVWDFRAHVDVDSTGETFSPNTKLNVTSYRNRFFVLSYGLNFYYTLMKKELFDIRLWAGGSINLPQNAMENLRTPPGVNGEGDDIYDSFQEYYWTDDVGFYNGQMYWSDWSGFFATYNTVGEVKAELPTTESNEILNWERRRVSSYWLVSAGLEAEVNKFLFGANVDLSVSPVDNILVKNYVNVNASLGYILFSKSRMNKNIKRQVN